MNPLALALLGLGLGSNALGQRKAARASRNAVNQGAQVQGQLQGKINREVMDNAQKVYDPAARAQRYESIAEGRTDALGAAMRDIDSAPAVDANGQVSKDYLVAKAGKAAEQAGAIAKLTRLVARAGVGDQMRMRDSITSLESADRVDGIAQRMRDEEALMQTRLADAEHAGDNERLVGQLLSMGALLTPSARAAMPAAAAPKPTWQSTGMFIFPSANG